MRRLVLGATAMLLSCGESRTPPEPAFIAVAEDSPLPFSAAVRVGDMLYLSSQIGTDSTGNLVAGGIEPETRQTMENVHAVVEALGARVEIECLAAT